MKTSSIGLIKSLSIVLLTVWVFYGPAAYGALIPPGQDVGAKVRVEDEEKKRKMLAEKVTEEKKEAQVEGEEKVRPQEPAPAVAAATRF